MALSEDILKIIDQEQGLVFSAFGEQEAFDLGVIVRERALKENLGLVCDVRLWDRPLFYAAMPGTTADNPEWVRRKANTVRQLLKSSYRATLETEAEDRMFPVHRNLPVADFALSGGGFPIRVDGAGVIGAMTVSGLHEREDHEVVVAAICQYLGRDGRTFALPVRRVT